MNSCSTPSTGSEERAVIFKNSARVLSWKKAFRGALLLALAVIGACALPALSYAQTTSTITVSFAGNGIETSSVSNSLIYSFNDLSAGTYSSVSWTNGTTNVGSFSNLTIANPDQYGGSSYGSTNGTTLAGGNSTYADAIGGANTNVATGVRLTFSSPVNFFGLWWSAGDGGNNLAFYNGTNLVGSYNTAYLYSKLTNQAYFGMPTGPYKGQNTGEPYVFLNFIGGSGTTFTSVVAFQASGGGNFESDNWTVNASALGTNGVIVENFGNVGGTPFTNTANFIAPTLASAALSTNGVVNTSNSIVVSSYLLLDTNGSVLVGTNPSITLNLSNNATAYMVGGTNYTEHLDTTSTISGNITTTFGATNLGSTNGSNFTVSITNTPTLGTNGGSLSLSYASETNGSGSQRLGGESYIGTQTVTLAETALQVATISNTTNVNLGAIHVGMTFGAGTVDIQNISSNTAYTETLGVSNIVSTNGVSNNISTFTNLAVGSTNSYSVNLVTNPPTGTNTGTIVLKYASYDTNGNLAAYSLGSQTITVTGFVYTGKSIWMGTNGGNWSSLGSWDAAGGTPGVDGKYSTNDTATFNTNGSGTVNVDSTNVSLMTLNFSNSTSSYTLYGSSTLTLTNGSNAPTVNVQAGSHTISIDLNLAANVTFSNAASSILDLESNVVGTGAIIKTGAGTLILGASNSYSGGTTLNAGTVAISDNNAFSTGSVTFASNSTVMALTNLTVTNNYFLPNSTGTFDVVSGATLTNSGVITGNGGMIKTDSGTLVLTGANTYNQATVISGGILQIGNGGSTGSIASSSAITDNATLIFNLSSTTNITQSISGTGTVIQNGSGTTTLGPANSYSGGTVVNSGTLIAGNINSFGTNTGTITVNGGTLNASNFNVTSGAMFLGNGTITGSGQISSSIGITATNSNAALISEVIAGAGTLIENGTGTTTITKANTYSGGTILNAGDLQVSNSSGFGTGTITFASNATVGALANLNITNRYAVASGQIASFDANGFLLTNSGVISGSGAISLVDTGTVILTGANTYSGGTTIGAGTLQVGTGGTSGSLGTGNVTNNGALVFNLSSSTNINQAVSGSGTLYQNGAGTIILSGSNSYTGGTILDAGTLAISNNYSFGNGTVTFASNATVQALTNLGLTNNFVITNGKTGTFDDNGFIITNSGVISGAGALTKIDVGTLILTGTNTYSGGTTIGQGTLQIGSGGTTGTAGTGNITNNGSLEFDLSSSTNFSQVISGTGKVIQEGTGTTTLTASNSYSGGTIVDNGMLTVGNTNALGASNGTITVNGGTLNVSTYNITSGAVSLGNGTISGTGTLTGTSYTATNTGVALVSEHLAGTGTFTENGAGTTTLTASNTYSGGTLLNAGTLAISNNNAFGTGTVTFASNATVAALTNLSVTNSYSVATGKTASFDANGFTLTNAGVISGLGGISLVDTGTVILSKSNTYAGITTIGAGTLQIGTGGAEGTIGTNNVTDNGQLVYDLNTKVTNSAVISGTGGLSQIGSGTLFLTGTNTFTGTTTINSGAISLGTNGKIASTNIVVNSGGTLLLGGNNQTTNSAGGTNPNLTLNGGTLSTGGSGTTTRAGTNTFGTLTLTANSTIDFTALSGSTALDFSSILGLGTYTLTILDWNGTELSGTGVGNTNTPSGLFDFSTLTATELSHISFYSGTNTNSGFLGTAAFRGHELVPVPEPAVIVAGSLLLAWMIPSLLPRLRRKEDLFVDA